MSGQLIELIIFAGIAFFIINKLISTLGSTAEDDRTKNSIFGEPRLLKDVTYSDPKVSILKPVFTKKGKINLNGLIVESHKSEIEAGLVEVINKLPNFNLINFLKASKAVFKMIIEAGTNESSQLGELVDKRYLGHFKSMAPSYGEYNPQAQEVSAQVSEIYTFGNNIFVKVLFTGKNITNKIIELNEEWSFTKSTISQGPEWYLTNIDRLQ